MENNLLVVFKKPYLFEGTTYNEVDLSELQNMTVMDMIASEKEYLGSGATPILVEMTVDYACIVAAKTTGKPIEFFKQLPIKEGVKLKNMVSGFFYSAE